jgi:hypothetical protein
MSTILTRVRSRVRSQLAQRAPSLERKAVEARWRSRNRARSYRPSGPAAPALQALVDDFKRDGIAIGTIDGVFGSSELYDEAAAAAWRLYELHQASNPEVNPNKPYLANLLHDPLPLDHPFARVALHPNVLEIANRYLGMRAFLRTVSIWLTKPTPGPAIETQLWHRDGDDVMQVKLFMPFTSVTMGAGPFCYAPGTHPSGSRAGLVERDAKGRSTDEQLARLVPEPEWRTCTGDPGMLVFADTCGYHKQVKPETDERLLLMAQLTSGTPTWPRDTKLVDSGLNDLSVEQRFAVELDAV